MAEELKVHIDNYRYTEKTLNNIKFSLLDTPERFYEESSIMNHCVKTYCLNVAKGHYIIYSVEDLESGDRATLSINSNHVFSFNQLKAKNNKKSTDKIINSVKEFITTFFNIIDFSKNYDLIPDIQPKTYLAEEIILQNINEVQEINNYDDDFI